MTNFKLSVATATVLAMSTFAVAGGDIAPAVEPAIEVLAPAATESGFYIGGAYSAANAEAGYNESWNDGLSSYSENVDIDYDAFMLQAGYQFNKYIAIEGRYWSSVSDGEWSWSENVDGGIYVIDRQKSYKDGVQTDVEAAPITDLDSETREALEKEIKEVRFGNNNRDVLSNYGRYVAVVRLGNGKLRFVEFQFFVLNLGE